MPSGKKVVAIVGATGSVGMVKENARVASGSVPLEALTVMYLGDVTAVVGVPEITPVALSRLNPVGK